MMIASIGGATFIIPTIGRSLFPYNMIANIGELILAGWLIIFGVDAERWRHLDQGAATV